MHALRHLLVGTDFSASADAALAFAIALARLGGAALTVVHVCAPNADPAEVEDISQACRARLVAVCARASRAGVMVTPVLRSGPIADKIHNVATEVGASVIVIGLDPELGRVAERVLRTASRPVLAVSLVSWARP